MAASDFPYTGEWTELQEIRSEMAKNQAHRAMLDREYQVLQEHQRHVLKLIREKS
jgi:hypothetical protein